MVRHDDPVGAALARQARVLRMDDALEDQPCRPAFAHDIEVVPVEVIAAAQVALHVARQDRRATLGEIVLEVRHAMARDGREERAEGPARPHEAIPEKA